MKKNSNATKNDLVIALDEFCKLLAEQKEDEAIAVLQSARSDLSESKNTKEVVKIIIDCFEGEHELNAYTLHKQSEDWTVADQLSFYSTRVLSLAKRMDH